jgi:hypothetical protein
MCWFNGFMPPRWGWELFLDAGFYKHVAPTGLAHPPPGEILKTLGHSAGHEGTGGMLK